jgi:hypothetical protein
MLPRLGMSESISRARWTVCAATCIALVLLAGCAGMNDSFRWVDRTLYGEAEGPARVAYVAADRTKVYGAPDVGSPVQGVLALHEKVSRYQSPNGFAFVEAEGNVSGWVVERQLAASPTGPTPAAAPRPAAPTPEAAQTTPRAEPTPAEETTPAPEAQPAPEEEPARDGEPEPSVFDPY